MPSALYCLKQVGPEADYSRNTHSFATMNFFCNHELRMLTRKTLERPTLQLIHDDTAVSNQNTSSSSINKNHSLTFAVQQIGVQLGTFSRPLASSFLAYLQETSF
jgi:hypothetical protein